jgi:hypothetical protein
VLAGANFQQPSGYAPEASGALPAIGSKLLWKEDLGEVVGTTPAVVVGCLFVRTGKAL